MADPTPGLASTTLNDRVTPAAVGASSSTDGAINSYRNDRSNPDNFTVSLGAKGGTERLLRNLGTSWNQRMQGFEESYVGIIDYLVRITHHIWEDKNIG